MKTIKLLILISIISLLLAGCSGAGSGGDTSAPPAASMPTPRPGLEATNPGDVVLSSGRVQLIEFFAFW